MSSHACDSYVYIAVVYRNDVPELHSFYAVNSCVLTPMRNASITTATGTLRSHRFRLSSLNHLFVTLVSRAWATATLMCLRKVCLATTSQPLLRPGFSWDLQCWDAPASCSCICSRLRFAVEQRVPLDSPRLRLKWLGQSEGCPLLVPANASRQLSPQLYSTLRYARWQVHASKFLHAECCPFDESVTRAALRSAAAPARTGLPLGWHSRSALRSALWRRAAAALGAAAGRGHGREVELLQWGGAVLGWARAEGCTAPLE
jgi:hypothetical protein